ncbi:MAG TPA: serine/threonine-protein kinase [Myxococcaceae bacterium]|nr:serine/threonine-protein kinase [Myxococcaceae bacterium]
MDDPKPPGDVPEAAQPTLIGGQSLAHAPAASLPRESEGRYQEVLMLGRGGMGEVLLCTDGVLGRQLAMKVIHPDAVTKADRVQRFVREAKLQGQLEHPSIVPVYDLGSRADGAPFFTMSRVHGVTLEEVLFQLSVGDAATRRKYTRRKLLEAFSRVCLALDFAHARGVLHRDLKPSNVMFGDFGEVYVLDWGLARPMAELDPPAADGPPADESPRTQAGSVLGTPGYMSPEQIDRSVPLDSRSDVYSLGAILFELLTLQRLHAGDSQEQVLESTLSLPEGRPSVRSPEADVPPELEVLCAGATALDREKRPATVRALHDGVERFLEGERDLALRHEMAARHAQRAVSLADMAGAASAPDASLELRRRAIREVGQALALDPDHQLAAQTLVRLLSSPPSTTPPEAADELAAVRVHRIRSAGRIGALTYAGLVFYLPLLLWMGIREWHWVAVLYAGVALAAGTCAVVGSRRAPGAGGVLVAAAGGAVMTFCTSLSLGPFVVQPTLAAVNVMALSFLLERRHRIVVAVLGLSSLALPAVLGWLGLWPSSYSVSGDSLVISSPMLHLPLVPTLALLAVTSLAPVVIAVWFVGRIRDDLADAERKLAVQAWSLRQLLPERPPA